MVSDAASGHANSAVPTPPGDGFGSVTGRSMRTPGPEGQ